jgi:hypothetical protein
MVYPLGIPALFAFLLLVRFKAILDEQRDKEQLQIDTQKAVGHGTRLEERKSRWSQCSASSKRISAPGGVAMNVSAVAAALKHSRSTESITERSAAAEATKGVTAVYGETTDVLKELHAVCTATQIERAPPPMPRHALAECPRSVAADLGFLLNPYLLKCYPFEIVECLRKIALVGLPVFFINASLEQLVIGLVVCVISIAVFAWWKPYRDPADNTLQMLCQMGIFFALVAKVILSHPDTTDAQSDTLGVMILVLVLSPVALVILHILVDPTDNATDAIDPYESPALAMVPGAARVKRALGRAKTAKPSRPSAATKKASKVTPHTTSQTADDSADAVGGYSGPTDVDRPPRHQLSRARS